MTFSVERLLPLRGPERPRVFALIALEPVGHPKQRYLKPGDRCRIEIEGLGSMETPIVEGE